jgi:hypothetical protein
MKKSEKTWRGLVWFREVVGFKLSIIAQFAMTGKKRYSSKHCAPGERRV